MKKTTQSYEILGTLLLILALAVVIQFGGTGEVMSIVRIVLGSVVLLFVPGWWITKAAFSKKEIDILERVALSFALSIAVIPLVVFYANLAGARITETLVLGVVFGVVLVSVIVWLQKSKKKI